MATKTAAKKAPASAKKTTVAKAPARKSPRAKDACDLLDADHKAVKKMFEEFRTLSEGRGRSTAKKRELAQRICTELLVHTQIEEEIFYPAARGAIKDNALMNEAMVEHASAKDLIEQIQNMDEADELFDARVLVLGEYIDHHVKEERNELFPKVRQSRLDLVGMREELEARKEELMNSSEEEEQEGLTEEA